MGKRLFLSLFLSVGSLHRVRNGRSLIVEAMRDAVSIQFQVR